MLNSGFFYFFNQGAVLTTQNFVWFAKKSVNAKPFLVRIIFCTHQNFCKRYETSKIPSTSFESCKNFVRRENPLFLDIHPSLGHQILQHNPAILIELHGFAQKPPYIV